MLMNQIYQLIYFLMIRLVLLVYIYEIIGSTN
uniref:Uncharacterized protein n=1 Tax=Arundo donax TaxID=35708 RepID=A0A0A8ZJ29_ARUDO